MNERKNNWRKKRYQKHKKRGSYEPLYSFESKQFYYCGSLSPGAYTIFSIFLATGATV
jgi:hypothetical protein